MHPSFHNQLYFTGNTLPIAKGTEILLVLEGVANPLRKMQTPLFQYQILEAGTNNTLQISEAVEGLNIAAGSMRLVQMFTLYPQYFPYAGYFRWFVLQFRPKNPFIAARITTNFFQVMSCHITAGLLDPSANSDSTCKPGARVMYLNNFAPYQASAFETDYVEVRFRARIGYDVLLTNPVQIYTYADTLYQLLVDQDVDSIST